MRRLAITSAASRASLRLIPLPAASAIRNPSTGIPTFATCPSCSVIPPAGSPDAPLCGTTRRRPLHPMRTGPAALRLRTFLPTRPLKLAAAAALRANTLWLAALDGGFSGDDSGMAPTFGVGQSPGSIGMDGFWQYVFSGSPNFHWGDYTL